jgi:hypothetical protein
VTDLFATAFSEPHPQQLISEQAQSPGKNATAYEMSSGISEAGMEATSHRGSESHLR